MSLRKAPSDQVMVEAFERNPHRPDRWFPDAYPEWGVSWKTVNRHRARLMGLRRGGDVSGVSRRNGLKGSTRTRIRRVLQDAENRWLAIAEIDDEMRDRFGEGVSKDTIRRTLYRMLEKGQVRRRVDRLYKVSTSLWRYVAQSFEGEGLLLCGICGEPTLSLPHKVGRPCPELPDGVSLAGSDRKRERRGWR